MSWQKLAGLALVFFVLIGSWCGAQETAEWQRLLAEANRLRDAEKYDEALAEYGRALAANPKAAEVFLNRGILHMARQQDALAMADFDKGVALAPKSPNAYYTRGNAWLARGEFPRALDDFTAALAIDGEFRPARAGRVECCIELKKTDLMLEDVAAMLAKPGRADRTPEQLLGSSDWWAWVGLNLPPERQDLAEAVYSRALAERAPHAPESHELALILFELGWLRHRQKKFEEALSYLNRALGIYRKRQGPPEFNFGWVLYALGRSHQELEHNAQAAPFLNEAADVFQKLEAPDMAAMAYDHLGTVYAALEKNAEAATAFRASIALDRKNAEAKPLLLAAKLYSLGKVLHYDAKYEEALAAFEEDRQIREKELPPDDLDLAWTYTRLGDVYLKLTRHAEAAAMHRAALEIRRKKLAPSDPLIGDSLHDLGLALQRDRKHDEARPVYEEARRIREPLEGADRLGLAWTLHNLALIHSFRGQLQEAERLHREALAIRLKQSGENDEDVAASLGELGSVFHDQGRYADAERTFQREIAIRENLPGDNQLSLAASLVELGHVQSHLGQYAQSEQSHKRALAIRRERLAEDDPAIANSLVHLATSYHNLGLWDDANPLLRQALKIYESQQPADADDVAWAAVNLGHNLQSQGRYEEAESYMLTSLRLRRELRGERDLFVAKSIMSLAETFSARAQYAKAQTLLDEALAIYEQLDQSENPHVGYVLNEVAWVHLSQGKLDEAQAALETALRHLQMAAGPDSPEAIGTELTLAALFEKRGEAEKALPLVVRSLDLGRQHQELAAALQSEHSQLAMFQAVRYRLDRYLSLATRAGVSADDGYAQALSWKGSVFARQYSVRIAGRDPRLKPTFDQLSAVTGELANLVFAAQRGGGQAETTGRIRELAEQKEAFEAQLSRLSADFRSTRLSPQEQLDELKRALPSETVLVDLLEYSHSTPAADGVYDYQRRLAAFLVRRDEPVVRIDLGSAASLKEAVEAWRKTLGRGEKALAAARQLREQVWLPVEKHLGQDETVLISPDGAVARFPLIALPGKTPDAYLLEERAIAIVPVPKLLPELLGRKQDDPEAAPALLAIGDVDYNAETTALAGQRSRTAQRGEEALTFVELPNTRGELLALRDTFELAHPEGRAQLLRRAQATESALRETAPAFDYLHVATHGFFAPATAKPDGEHVSRGGVLALDAGPGVQQTIRFHPGLMSGLALSGANRPPNPGRDDGILTAEEAAMLDLTSARLAVLSACDTGLGNVAGGEGVLGLQRAFQVAGARSVVASLWKVSDDATRELMERFYENLWDKKLPPVEALRQAQLWMLRERGPRGLAPQEGEPPTSQRLPPYYWAAFVLSGDWR
jgi:CHAT domain-containing protein/Tfp pilus assembly protein PilF